MDNQPSPYARSCCNFDIQCHVYISTRYGWYNTWWSSCIRKFTSSYSNFVVTSLQISSLTTHLVLECEYTLFTICMCAKDNHINKWMKDTYIEWSGYFRYWMKWILWIPSIYIGSYYYVKYTWCFTQINPFSLWKIVFN